MTALPAGQGVATVATCEMAVATGKAHLKQCCSDRSDRSDHFAQDPAQKKTLGGFAARLRAAATAVKGPPVDQDAEELAAMVAYFSQPAGTGPPPDPDPMKAGLFRGFWAHRQPSQSIRRNDHDL